VRCCVRLTGCGGHKLSTVDFDRDDVFEYAEAEYGYLRMGVDGDRSMLLEYVYSENGAVGDTKEITGPNRQCKGRTAAVAEPTVMVELGSSLVTVNATALLDQISLSRPATVQVASA
jgi:hypothetical protein